jgi:hypothetical protein
VPPPRDPSTQPTALGRARMSRSAQWLRTALESLHGRGSGPASGHGRNPGSLRVTVDGGWHVSIGGVIRYSLSEVLVGWAVGAWYRNLRTGCARRA